MNFLPNSWTTCRLDYLAITKSGGTPSRKRADFYNGEIPWVKSGELNYNKIYSTEEYISENGLKNSSAILFPKGTLLIALYGATVGRLGILEIEATTNQAVCAVFPNEEIISKGFLYWFFIFKRPYLLKQRIGGAQPNISQNLLKNLTVVLPPLAEQRRIVTKIEELFSELDSAVESLKKAQQQLKTYRQSVLKHAFEGKLTAQWREEVRARRAVPQQASSQPAEPPLKYGQALLAEIRAERQRAYEKQLAEWEETVRAASVRAQRTVPRRPKPPKELPLLTEKDLAELPELPEGWVWVKLGLLTLGVEYGSSAKSKKIGKIPVLRMGNIQNMKFEWDDLVYSDNPLEIEKYLLKKNDVLFNRTNSPELVGKTAIYLENMPSIFAGYLIRINQISSLVAGKYLNYYLNSMIPKNHGNRVKTDGVNQSNINGQKLVNYPFPYTPLAEQNQIVSEIEYRLSEAEHLEQTIEHSLKQAEALRQSILKKTFEGRLVPQDPNDEPAEKLLERIKKRRGDAFKPRP